MWNAVVDGQPFCHGAVSEVFWGDRQHAAAFADGLAGGGGSAHEKVFITYINPSLEKGVFFAARLFDELSLRRPDVPILVVESRGTAGMLCRCGIEGRA